MKPRYVLLLVCVSIPCYGVYDFVLPTKVFGDEPCLKLRTNLSGQGSRSCKRRHSLTVCSSDPRPLRLPSTYG